MSIDDLWYKNAIIYCLDVEKYQDANADGIGDFAVLRTNVPEVLAVRYDWRGTSLLTLHHFGTGHRTDRSVEWLSVYGEKDRAMQTEGARSLIEVRLEGGVPVWRFSVPTDSLAFGLLVRYGRAARYPLQEALMPERKTIARAKQAKREGKSPTTQAGEFVHEEIEHVREGKHGARSAKQAIAIGLSKARRAGVKLPPPKKGTTSEATRKRAAKDARRGQSAKKRKPSAKRSRASLRRLKRESTSAASHTALSRQARSAAKRRRRRTSASD